MVIHIKKKRKQKSKRLRILNWKHKKKPNKKLPKQKRFNHKIHTLQDRTHSKDRAETDAQTYRKLGYSSRVYGKDSEYGTYVKIKNKGNKNVEDQHK